MPVKKTTFLYRFYRASTCFALLCLFAGMPVQASDFGTTGLIDVPTARMKADGSLTLTAAYDQRYKQAALTYQALPWLEMTYRYSGFENEFRWDRNYEVKGLLWEEGEQGYLPQVAVGVRDLIGTGVFGSEYVVASKRFGQLDVSLGVGWGRLAGEGLFENPLIYLSDRFETRRDLTAVGAVEEAGTVELGDFFSGPEVGLFGGLSYEFKTWPVTAMIEYNPDEYVLEVPRGGEAPVSPWSAGITWRAADNFDLALSLQHGSELGLLFQAYFDSQEDGIPKGAPPIISSFFLPQSEFPTGYDKGEWFDRLRFDASRSGLSVREATLSSDQRIAELVVANLNFQIWSDALAAHLAFADLHLPATVETIYFVVEEKGHRVTTVVMPRPSTSSGESPANDLYRVRVVSGRNLIEPEYLDQRSSDKVANVVNLRTKVQLFDPDAPVRYQLYASVDSAYRLNRNWSLQSSLAVNLTQNFDESNRRESDSVLPRVRTDIIKYLDDGATGIDKLAVQGRFTLGQVVHVRVVGGVLEQMYSGVSTDVLYWPTQSRIAYGASLAYVKKRDYNGGLQHLGYSAVTGFVSAFYASDFYNYDFGVHVGQYLAEDKGVTFEVRRTFRNGWQLGIWASLTDVSSDDFGEGSFDKGFYFQVPLGSIFGGGSGRSNFTSKLRPVQRDGGQRLEGLSGNIFWDLRSTRGDSFKLDSRLL